MPRYTVKVIPKSSRNSVEATGELRELKVKLTAAPVDGKANDALIEVLADYFKVRKSAVRLVSGASNRQKIVEVLL